MFKSDQRESVTYLELGKPGFKTRDPVAQEIFVWRNAQAGDDEWVRHMPISGFVHHVPSLGVYYFHRFCPQWMVNLGLRGLKGGK